jgi:hypothetical protein
MTSSRVAGRGGLQPRPGGTEEGGRLGSGADLLDGADRPERGIPERWIAGRRPVVRACVQIWDGAVTVAGRGAVVDRACGDAEVEVLRPEHRGAGLLVRDVRGEPAHALRAEAVPAGQQARRARIDEQRLVQVEWCRGPVHLGRCARGDAGEGRGCPDRGQRRPAGAGHVPDDQVGAVHREVGAIGPERTGSGSHLVRAPGRCGRWPRTARRRARARRHGATPPGSRPGEPVKRGPGGC